MESADFPALYQSADTSSLTAQGQFLLATKVRLLGLLLAAATGAFDLKVGHSHINPAALGGLVLFVVAVAAEIFLLASKPDRTWYEGRAAAESVKTLTWRYSVGGVPFPVDYDQADADFLGQIKDVLQDLSELHLDPVLTADQQITAAMRQLRASGLDGRKRAYEQDRIEDQRTWYANKSKWNGKRSNWWSVAAIVGETAGILAGALRAFDQIHFDLLGIFAALAAGATAWSQAKQYETLERAYFIASQELATIRSQVDAQDSKDWPTFVDKAEEAISREHTLWRASRGVRGSRRSE